MTYLVKYDNKIKECEEKEEVYRELKIACAIWTISPYYVDNLSWEELYQWCISENDFKDIAQVYEIDCYFTLNEGHKIPCGLYSMDKNVSMQIKRIL